MGKKGTKRKTKWRTLPLGEEAGGSGNEEDLHDEDQSTTSSVVGAHFTNNAIKRQPFYFKMPDKSCRQTRKFTYERFRNKEPLIKLESKTFDEEEYTKITTPRQDVLFKKGYFGRKRESSVEEPSLPSGEVDGEEPLMDQIIITNGFVDERGHYLVNGNSYEIYDPYSNTVTVVVGPPPYANGVTHPVLAAVSCQPVPLQPVDWYPPGADWPSQGSAWTPSFPRNPPPAPASASDTLNSPECAPAFPSPDSPPHHPYEHPPFLLPPSHCLYNGEPPRYNGVSLQSKPSTEPQNAEENKTEVKKTRRKSAEDVTEEEAEPNQTAEENSKTAGTPATAVLPEPPPVRSNDASVTGLTFSPPDVTPIEAQQKVKKESHGTQTNLPEDVSPPTAPRVCGKESHATQTPSEEVLCCNAADAAAQPKSNKLFSDIPLSFHPSPLARSEADAKERREWKPHGHRYNGAAKKFSEEFPRKLYHQRTNFPEERKAGAEKSTSSPSKVSYAKKAMAGLESAGQKGASGGVARIGSGSVDAATNGVANGEGPKAEGSGEERTGTGKQKGKAAACEDKRNGFVKARYGRGRMINGWQKCRDRRAEESGLEETGINYEDMGSESRSHSEKSSSVSELSSPTELSSGQNTPPEKLIVQKMEQEINKSFEVKLKKNLKSKSDVEEGTQLEGEEVEEQQPSGQGGSEKQRGKKKKSKGKRETEKPQEGIAKGGKRRKKRAGGEAKKAEEENSEEGMSFLKGIREREELFAGWEGVPGPTGEGQGPLPESGWFLNGDADILKSLGLDAQVGYSKLPLHSDLLMILPGLGWSQPKLKIKDFFASTPYDSDLFTKKNITNMKSTKPEEFFASVVDNPVVEKAEKKKESLKKSGKPEESSPPRKKPVQKTAPKPPRAATEPVVGREEGGAKEDDARDGKLGIVEAVSTWLQEQGDSEHVLSVDGLSGLVAEDEEEVEKEGSKQKNEEGNPIHVLSVEKDGGSARRGGGGASEGSECIRVANVINDGFVRIRDELLDRRKQGRIYRSSSWDAKLSEVKVKKPFQFLTDSASFCQDLISDVRNGLPAGNEFATEELCDPKQIVRKYYTLAPGGGLRLRSESDSENEVFDALEYKFLTKDKNDAAPCGKASITDSGVHSDVDLSEDAATDLQKEKTCKLQ